MNIKLHRRNRDRAFIVTAVLALLFFMLAIVALNTSTAVRLRREVKNVEKHQLARIHQATNQPPAMVQPQAK